MVLSAKYGRTQCHGKGLLVTNPTTTQECPRPPPVTKRTGREQGGRKERLTNATKDTVSVLYWYEEFSSLRLAIFGWFFGTFFFARVNLSPPPHIPHHQTPTSTEKEPSCGCVALRHLLGPWRTHGAITTFFTHHCCCCTDHFFVIYVQIFFKRWVKKGSTALRVPKSSLTSVLTKPVAA